MIRTAVYQGGNLLGDVEIYPQNSNNNNNYNKLDSDPIVLDHLMREKRVRISKFSQPSERCPPLAVLYTIASGGICLKMESNDRRSNSSSSPLSVLHSSCLRENKTAIVMLGEEELHLVAMPSRRNDERSTCFWGFTAMTGLYDSCLVMLNLRCLAIVFDLDETLVVANTMRSFEDRIDSLQRKMNIETDQQRVAGMVAEMKRYQDDRAILKQFIETNQVIDDGEVIQVQTEFVPALSDNHQPILRPLIRLQDKNIVLTRINPMIRDTSVLVRIRPAWEELRSYLTARGRKRFEVYVCTMAERDYALEMWRLLDPDSNLITTNELLDRIVCVKSGCKKSLFNVFHNRSCHPKMALVIDDRLKVWDEMDQPRVHVVPAFAPYFAPQAEANNVIPVLCMARNVACNVRGGFFKEFDDGLMEQTSKTLYEDDLKNIPFHLDVSNYLAPEDDTSEANENREASCFDGMADAEVERRLKEAIQSSTVPITMASLSSHSDPRTTASLQFSAASTPVPALQPACQGSIVPFPPNHLSQAAPTVSSLGHIRNPDPNLQASPARPLSHFGNADPNLQGSPAREEGEVPESELDPDTRRRLLILQHGQDTSYNLASEPQFSVRPPAQAPIPGPGPGPVSVPVPGPSPPPPLPPPGPHMQSRRSWFDDHMNPGQFGRAVPKEHTSDGMHVEKQYPLPPPFSRRMDNFVRRERPYAQKQRFPREGICADDHLRPRQSFQGEDVHLGRTLSRNKDFENESGRSFSSNKDLDSDSICSSSNYRDTENVSEQRISESETPAGALRDIGRKCGAKVYYKSSLAASAELRFLMEVYFAGEKIGEGKGRTRREAQHYAAEVSLMSLADKYLSHIRSDSPPKRGDICRPSGANDGVFRDSNSYGNQSVKGDEPSDLTLDCTMGSRASVLALKEMCMEEGFSLDYKGRPPLSAADKDEVYAQVEIDGQVFSRGIGLTWDEAKAQAAEKALASLKSMLGYNSRRRSGSPRSVQGMSNKRMRPQFGKRQRFV